MVLINRNLIKICCWLLLHMTHCNPLGCIRLIAIPWAASSQAPLSSTVSWSLLNSCPLSQWCYLTIWSSATRPFLLLPSVFPSIRIFSTKRALLIRWAKYWSFNFSNSSSNEYSELISFRIDWFDLLAFQGASLRVFASTRIRKHPFFGFRLLYAADACMHAQSLQSCPTLCDRMDCSPPCSSVHKILQARILESVTVPSFRVSSPPRDWTWVSCTAAGFFTTEPLGKP